MLALSIRKENGLPVMTSVMRQVIKSVTIVISSY